MAAPLARLETVLSEFEAIACAVSGGVDSLTLATFAHRRFPEKVKMYHAVSPAVPPGATLRVHSVADQECWTLSIIDAGEFLREDYRANPVNRCYFCKTSLYGAIRPHAAAQLVSGTNLDDLGEYRPGLIAAQEHQVRHPFVEAAIDKSTVRAIARELGLGHIAELPAAPCLSSRVETGIRIEPEVLERIHATENLVQERLQPKVARCRVRATGVVIELDERALSDLGVQQRQTLAAEVQALFASTAAGPITVSFAIYRNGSAFLIRELKRPS